MVRCAFEVQRGMTERNAGVAPEKRINFRIGINLGDVIAEEHNVFGDGVNVAARLQGRWRRDWRQPFRDDESLRIPRSGSQSRPTAASALDRIDSASRTQ